MKKLVCLVFFVLTGCSTMSSLDSTSKEGQAIEVSGRSYEEVYQAAYTVLSKDYSIENADQGRGVINASKSISAFSWGEVFRVTIEPVTPAASYTVRVVSLKRYKLQVTGGDLERAVLNKIQQAL